MIVAADREHRSLVLCNVNIETLGEHHKEKWVGVFIWHKSLGITQWMQVESAIRCEEENSKLN